MISELKERQLGLTERFVGGLDRKLDSLREHRLNKWRDEIEITKQVSGNNGLENTFVKAQKFDIWNSRIMQVEVLTYVCALVLSEPGISKWILSGSFVAGGLAYMRLETLMQERIDLLKRVLGAGEKINE
ncbi:MAG: hypothetical protein Q7R97_03800 [Candidatus Daviesbacteria bacterium]|nr:hypothetical protein [Candidatus Daviesbacteria bacterium]